MDDFDAYPTPETLTDDLEKIVHGLDRWPNLPLAALRALPSVRLWNPPPGLDTRYEDKSARDRSNLAILQRIGEAIGRLALEADREALSCLFAFKTPKLGVGQRQKEAAPHRETTAGSFRKSGERILLEELADEMFRGEMAWTTRQLEPVSGLANGLSVNAWCRWTEFERLVEIGEENLANQRWTTRIVMRCVRPDHPFLVIPQRWSGGGDTEPGKVRILSGPKEGEPFRHTLLSVRPESEATDTYNLYIWDLGAPVFVGDIVILHYEQTLTDSEGIFQPMIGFGTERHPDLTKVVLGAKIPEQLASHVYTKHLVTSRDLSAGSYVPNVARAVTPSKSIKRDKEGLFSYTPQEVMPSAIYELHWGDA
jgi:hypothetical protein